MVVEAVAFRQELQRTEAHFSELKLQPPGAWHRLVYCARYIVLNFETPDVLGGGRTVHFLPAWKAHQKYVGMGRGETTWHSVVKAIVLN